ncbi:MULTISPECIES: FmdE family protein [Desulfobacula]|uniref:Formylmethanofuran dehydrogenase, subunit E n=2 Tax=Desulfobacula TaxID=28222 RepID=K0NL66_DESTT|nr:MULTISPECIES: FmdE family protein [Desulfobacula]CCK82321.1 formylmethanofuran dehydrogenase, subunit E [Desulfobacula toluolica Tol2]SDU51111.1 formylmethanofuran dehydrogenase subunit E [Desulfobacula phenolica]
MSLRKNFETLLNESAIIHGHLCSGQVIGVRMAILGCRLIGLDDPRSHTQIKKLIVYLEMDRCAGDAVAHVTGVKLGRRSLKFMNYGIMAATFLNLETQKAFRIISTEESRDLAQFYAPEIEGKAAQQLAAYKRMPDYVLFRVQEVNTFLKDYDMPGPTRSKTICSRCGQVVRDHREVMIDNMPVCRPCTEKVYFSDPHEISMGDMDWAPVNKNTVLDTHMMENQN